MTKPVGKRGKASKSEDICQAITANALADGRVVFWKGSGVESQKTETPSCAPPEGWGHTLEEAKILTSAEARNAEMEAALESVKKCQVIDVYAIDLIETPPHMRPARLREAIRAYGPTV